MRPTAVTRQPRKPRRPNNFALGALDAAFIRMETPRTPMHVGGLLIFHLPPHAPLRYLRDLLARLRSHPVTTPPFNRRLAPARWPWLARHWREERHVDLSYHIREATLPYPGGDRQLNALISQLHSRPLDFERPLWECYLIRGLRQRRFALYLKLHHAISDGISALHLISQWLSDDPQHQNAAGPWALPAATQARRAASTADEAPLHTLQQLGRQLRASVELGNGLRKMWRRKDHPDGGLASVLHVPRLPFNRPIGAHRRVATQHFALARFRALSQASGATINDLTLAVCTGALRRYLLAHAALPEVPLVAFVPVGLAHHDGNAGNAVAGLFSPLPTQDADPLQRLQLIRRVTGDSKQALKSLSDAALMQFAVLGISPMILGQISGLLARLPPAFNLVISNVHGPAQKLYLHGAELESMTPLSIVLDGYGLNITAVGYADQLTLGLVACRDAVPDLEKLAAFTVEAFDELEACLLPTKASTDSSMTIAAR